MRLLIAVVILSLALTGEGRPSLLRYEPAVLSKRYLPSNDNSSTEAFPNVVCRPTQWYDVCLFYFTNYIVHALSVRSLPGEGHVSSIGFKFLCLLIPFTGVRRGLKLVVRASNLAKNDLQAAAKAGALCMVVRSKDWRPRDGDVLDGCTVERVNADAAGNPVRSMASEIQPYQSSSGEASSTFEKSGIYATVSSIDRVDALISVQSPYKTPSGLPIIAKLAESSIQRSGTQVNNDANLITDIANVNLHGLCKLAPGYELRYVPGDMKVYPRQMLHNAAVRPTDVDYRTIFKQTKIASSHAFPRMLFSLAQTFSGGYQLYKVRGAQISQFGFASYGFTVIPYVIVSIINFIGCVLSNEYACAYVTHSEIMDEMIDRGGIVDGVAGTITVPREILGEGDLTSGESLCKVDGKRFLIEGSTTALRCRSVAEFPTESFTIKEPEPAVVIPKAPLNIRVRKFFRELRCKKKAARSPATSSITITVPSQMSFTRLPRRHFQVYLDVLSLALLFLSMSAPWLIIGLFSGFHSYNASQVQLNYAIMWLAAGQFHAYLGGSTRVVAKGKPWQTILLIFLSYGAYCVGGFVIVAEELVQSGICSDTSLWYLQ